MTKELNYTDALWAVRAEADAIYCDPNLSESGQYNQMQRFLSRAAKEGRISQIEQHLLARDIMEAHDPYMSIELEKGGF